MNQSTETSRGDSGKPRWVAIGFVGAFALSVFTVIYTGLNVQGRSSAEFDSGFRSVTMAVGDVRSIDLVFESEQRHSEASLEVSLPIAVRFVDEESVDASDNDSTQSLTKTVAVVRGSNTYQLELEATQAGSGYVVARVESDQPIGLYRVFVTVTGE